MLFGFFILLVYWLAGEWVTALIGWPIPGNVVGLLLLWITLTIYRQVPKSLVDASSALIRYLTLLFVPAGVGLIQHWDRLMSNGLWIILIIAISTVLAALTMIALFKLLKAPGA
ncbi:CidA/LrgA family protein [Saccharospirillum mangrovi]|uniref:CidA/LrgA family protein n=1 Tax=Saccharospirillum mangrovi TaxID=2161747 RepID=UPI000D3A7961|nr:CidA/LrgA family protein [Saccharospirillum mangrovi]